MSDYQPGSCMDEDDMGFEANTVGQMNRKNCPLKLVLLDTGIVGHLNEADRENLHQVMLAVTLGKVGSFVCQNCYVGCHFRKG